MLYSVGIVSGGGLRFEGEKVGTIISGRWNDTGAEVKLDGSLGSSGRMIW